MRQRLSKHALIIGKQSKDLKTLSEEKRGFEIELNNMYQSIISEIIEQSKDLKILREDKEKMELDFNDKLEGKECEIRLHQAQLNLETFKLNDLIGKLKNELQSKETKIRKCQKQVEETLEMKAWTSRVQKQIIEKLSKDLKILHEDKEKMKLELNIKLQGKETEIRKYQNQVEIKACTSWVQKQIIDKEKMEAELNDQLQGKELEIQLLQSQFEHETFKLNDTIGNLRKYIDTLLKKLQYVNI